MVWHGTPVVNGVHMVISSTVYMETIQTPMIETVRGGDPSGVYVAPRMELALRSYSPSWQGMCVAIHYFANPDRKVGKRGGNTKTIQWIFPRERLRAICVTFWNVKRSKDVPLTSMSHLLCRLEAGPDDPACAALDYVDPDSRREIVSFFFAKTVIRCTWET